MVTRDCMSATGSEFEFMNMEAAVAKFLEGAQATNEGESDDVHLSTFQTTCTSEPVSNEGRYAR